MGSITRKSPRWRLALLLGLVLLSACSSTTFFYNRLGFILPWYLGRYVDLERPQSQELSTRMGELLDWHRYEELPRYVELITAMEAQLDEPMVTLETVQHFTDEFEMAWYRVRDRMMDSLLDFGAGLSDEQIDGFIAKLEKKQRKYERKYLPRDDDDFYEDSFKEMREAVEQPLGRLTPAQRERVRQASQSLLRSDTSWLDERAEWIEVTAQDLQRESGWQERIRRRVIDWEARTDEATMALYEHNTAAIQSMIVDVVNMRTEKQEKRIRRRLAGYREDFETLSAQEK